MPNVWAHLLFGQQALRQLGRETMISSKESRNAFNLGCQGPDFLFYHNFLPWQTSKHMNELGSEMHSKHCGPVLLDMLRHVRGRPLTDPASAYVMGFVLHHVLDRNAHPFVFYMSGFKKWNHQRYEIIMDTLIARKLAGIETWKTPVWKEIETGGEFPDGIVDMFEAIVRKHYPEHAFSIRREDWNKAGRDMIQAQRLFHDPSGVKCILTFNRIEPFLFKRDNAPLDYLNEARKPWHCPTDPNEWHNESVWDLWDIALEDARILAGAAFAYLEQEDRVLESGKTGQLELALTEAMGNRSYETGKPCDSGLTIQYVNPII